MGSRTGSPRRRVKLRRYPNRRYYDVTHSRHATLEEIHRLIRDGSDVQVTDSKTGEDITAKVLAQIILEHDAPKLDIFPVELLHQVIRASEPLVRDFVEKYFSRAFAAFVESQQEFNRYLREALGLDSPFAAAAPWTQMMFGPLARAVLRGGEAADDGEPPAGQGASTAELRQLVEQLRAQVDALQEEIQGR